MTKIKKQQLNPKQQWFDAKIRLLMIVVLGGILLGLVFNPSMFTGGDNAQYITLAKSILQGEYRNLAFIGQPIEIEIPPGYPLVITPLIALFPNSYIPTKLLSFFSMLIGIWVSLLLFDRFKVPKLAGFLFGLALLANPIFNEFSHWTLTEAPYFAMSVLGVYLFDKYYDSEKGSRFVLASAVVFLSMYIRPVAIPLVVAALIFLLVLKMFKRAGIFALTGAVLYGPWFLRTIFTRQGGEESFYLVNFFGKNTVGDTDAPGLFEKVFSNLQSYLFRDLPTVFTAMGGKTGPLFTTIGAVAAIAILTGLIILLKDKKTFVPYYAIIYFGMLMVYNPRFATFRYLMPIIPIMFIALWVAFGIEKPINLSSYRSKIILALSGVMLVLSLIAYVPVAKANRSVLKNYSAGNKYVGLPHVAWVRFIDACEWIKTNTASDGKIISRKPRISYILAERPGKVYSFTENPAIIMSEIDSIGADYVLIDRISGTTQAYLIPAIQAYPHRFQLVHQTQEPATYVMKVLPPEPPRQEIPATPEERND